MIRKMATSEMPAPLWRIAAVAVIALVVILPQGPLQGMALAQAAGRSMNVPPIAAASDSEKRAAAPKHGALPLPDVSQRNPGRTGDGAAIRKLINEGTALTRTAAQASSETMAAATPPAAPKPAMTSTTAAPDASAGKGRRLRIGYPARTNETALNPAFFERLADFLPAGHADHGQIQNVIPARALRRQLPRHFLLLFRDHGRYSFGAHITATIRASSHS